MKIITSVVLALVVSASSASALELFAVDKDGDSSPSLRLRKVSKLSTSWTRTATVSLIRPSSGLP